jgi:predicted MFS family arabinose efflux permease
LIAGPTGAFLSQFPFRLVLMLCALLYALPLPLFHRRLVEPPMPGNLRSRVLADVWQQFRSLARSRTLWAAAGLVSLVIAAPGFGTPLLYYQVDVLKFTKSDIGILSLIGGIFGMAAAGFYAHTCRTIPLARLLTASIVIHAAGTLFYLAYRSLPAAIVIAAIEGAAQTLAILPLYDLAARATPRGSEALGYSLMMSVWNLTASLSDLAGSYLHDRFHLTILHLVWLNAGSTALVLFAIPFLPAVLMRRRDGEHTPAQEEPEAA